MSVTSQESSLESDSKLSNAGEKPDHDPRPSANLVTTLVPTESAVDNGCVTKTTNAHTQTVVEREEAVEFDQQPILSSSGDIRNAATETVDLASKVKQNPVVVNGYNGVDERGVKEIVNEVGSRAKLNGGLVNGKEFANKEVNGERLTNGHEYKTKSEKKTEKKGKKVNGLVNGVVNGVVENTRKLSDDSEDFVFQDDSFLYTQEFINGNVKVELDEESEWITVKGHKGSQGKRLDSGRFSEEKKFPSELTNGYTKTNRDFKVNGVSAKDKVPFKNSSDKFNKTDKGYYNGRVEDKCTYTKGKQFESGNKEKTQFNGKAKLMNGNKMDGNEKEDLVRGKELNNGEGAEKKPSAEKDRVSPESPKDVPRKSIQEVEEATPTKPSRKERKSQKNGSPPKTPEVTLTAMSKPFEMPSVSLRPETFVKLVDPPPKPDTLSGEDSLLAALTVTLKDAKTVQEVAKDTSLTVKEESPGKESKKTGEVAKKTNSGAEKKRKSQQSPESSKVSSLKDLTTKSIEKDGQMVASVGRLQDFASVPTHVVKSLKDTSKEFLEQETRHNEASKTPSGVDDQPIKTTDAAEHKYEEGRKEVDSDPEATPPIPPPRRKKWRPAGKRLSSERAPTPGKTGESTDESSSSSSQESEESVIECLSSGFNSPKVKISSELSSDDDDIIYQGHLGESDPKALGRISESQEDSTSQNGKPSKRNNSSKKVLPETKLTPSKQVAKEVPKSPLPQVSIQSSKFKGTKEKFSGIYKSEEHLKNVQKMAKEIVDSVIEEAMKESVRLKYQKDNDPVKLGITDAVTRWLRSQSPDVLSLPRNEDSESDISEDFEEDAEAKTDTGSKNLKSNPLPAPSVKDIDSQLNENALVGDDDGTGTRVANKTSEKKDLKDSRNETPDMEDDVTSNGSVSCGEWDLWDCHHTIAQHYDDLLNKPHKKHTKNTNEQNIISSDTIAPHPLSHTCDNSLNPLVPEYLSLPQEQVKYDPLANDTFSPIESTLLNEILETTNLGHDRCTNMCDPALSVAKYYILGPHPGKTMSPIEDLECSDSDESSLTENNNNPNAYQVSLAEELARLEQPLPESWAVEPIRIEKTERPKRCSSCHCNGQESGVPADCGVESGEESTVTRKRESMSVFKRKLVGRLKGEGAPFPCGGICCILQ